MESIHILSSHCTSFVSYEKRFNSQELPFPFPHFTKIQTGPQARLVVKSVVITESANNQDSQNKSKTCKIYHKNEQNQTKITKSKTNTPYTQVQREKFKKYTLPERLR